MRLRSLLFVPGDRVLRMEKAVGSGADAVILDLEDSVAPTKKNEARKSVAEFLLRPRTLPLFVRVNRESLGQDLAAIVPAGPTGIMLPKATGAASLKDLDRRLTRLGDAKSLILPIVTETPAAVFALGQYAGGPRLCALTWGVEDLSATMGANPRDHARYTEPFETVRALVLLAAHAANVAAIETLYPALHDEAGLKAHALRGRRDGFCGMLAIHPAQVAPINQAFSPSAEEIEWARRVVDAFAAQPDAGVLELGGRMVDAPHLARAKAILADAEAVNLY